MNDAENNEILNEFGSFGSLPPEDTIPESFGSFGELPVDSYREIKFKPVKEIDEEALMRWDAENALCPGTAFCDTNRGIASPELRRAQKEAQKVKREAKNAAFRYQAAIDNQNREAEEARKEAIALAKVRKDELEELRYGYEANLGVARLGGDSAKYSQATADKYMAEYLMLSQKPLSSSGAIEDTVDLLNHRR